VNVLPIGAMMGLVVMSMVFVHFIPLAMLLMVAIGACAGFFVVPMNALLQHRGHVLMGAGHSIAVQNFNENIGILVMVGLYALMVRSGMTVSSAIILFGVFVTASMLLVLWRHRANQREFDSLHLIGIEK
jgi:MFS transporter, LPLT family, lysophospholipid transporter